MDLIWHKKAVFRAKEIYNYYYQNNKKASYTIASDFEKAIESIRRFPYIGLVEMIITKSSVEYRSLLVRNRYKIIYSVDELSNIIMIITIWDCKKNPSEIVNDIY